MVGPGVRRVSLRLAAAPSSGTDRWTWSDPSRWPPPGAIVGLAEDRIEIAVVARWIRSEHVIKVMDRRTFLALGIALPVAVTANHLDRLGDVLTTRRVDALAVEGLERIGAACRRAWNHVPAPELLPHVAWQIRLLDELRPTSPALRPRILTLIGAMAALAGRMTFRDLQDPGGAEDHMRTALTAAQAADNPELTAYVLATWSYVVASRTARLTTAYGNGPLTEALQMLDEARRLAATSGSLTTTAYVAAASSEIQACDGDEPGSRRSIELGEGALSRRTGDDPLWIGHGRFDAVRLRANDAANLVRFERPEAVDVLRSVLGQYADERRQTRVYPLANLARALVQQGEIVEGAGCAGETLTLAVALGSGENIRRIRTLYGDDLREHRDHRAVRALGDRLAEL